ncbi:hypothetical protein BDB13_5637 [Rhodococcus sp. OK302]|nr:hypothetical protein BDB13_5637 [Rhodococcus sp. OK302]
MSGERILGVESTDLRGLAEDLRRGQSAAARDRKQGRCQDGGPRGDLGGEFVDLDRQPAEMVGEPVGQVGHQPGEVRNMRLNLGIGAGPSRPAGAAPPGPGVSTPTTVPGSPPTEGQKWPPTNRAVRARTQARPFRDCSTTHAAICAREVKPSLLRMCSTWPCAVRGEITNVVAICLLVRPSATRSAT